MGYHQKNQIGFRLQVSSFNRIIFNFLILAYIFALALPGSAWAAELYFSSQEARPIYQGEVFTVDVLLDTQEQEVNAIEAELLFSQDKIELIDISRGGSIFELWPEDPVFSNETGEVNFSGGVPKGFKGVGKILTLSFRPILNSADITTAEIIFRSGSRVLLNDGYGKEAALTFQPVDLVITDLPGDLPSISSKTHPNQAKWYQSAKLNVFWEPVSDFAYGYQLSKAEDKVIFSGEKSWEDIKGSGGIDLDLGGQGDGVFYFSLRQKNKSGDWSEKSVHFRIMIDSTLPENFTPKIGQDPGIYGGKDFLSFSAKDEMSGIDRYEAAEQSDLGIFNFIGDRFAKLSWKNAGSPYLLERQGSGNRIFVKAVDKAGNERVAAVSTGISVYAWAIPAAVLALILAVLAIAVIRRRKGKE